MTVQRYTPPQVPAQPQQLGQLPQLPFGLTWPVLIAIVVGALLLWRLLGPRGQRERRKQLRRARLKYLAESARIKAGA